MPGKIHRRRGAILAASLICLLIILLFSGAVVRGIVRRQHATRWEERHLQCFWLAESALARGVAQSNADPQYAGESWKVTLQNSGALQVGVAEIVVERASGQPERAGWRRIAVQARWPDDPIDRIVQSKELIIPVRERGPN